MTTQLQKLVIQQFPAQVERRSGSASRRTPFGEVMQQVQKSRQSTPLAPLAAAAKPWQAEAPVQVALFKTEQKGPLTALKDSNVAPAPARVTSASEPLVVVSADPTHVPTPDEIFGADPFVSNPEGIFLDWYSGQQRSYGFNRHYFATESAANILAERLGGTVVQANSILGDSGYFSQAQPNRMIRFPNGREVNAGIVASFYTHGYPQSYIDRLIANEIDPEGNYQNLATPVSIVRNGTVTSRSSIQSVSA